MTLRPPRALLVVAAISVLVALTPLAHLAARVFDAGPGRVAEILFRPRTVELATTSLGLAAAVAGACLVIGVPTAWVVARARIPRPGVWVVLLALPLALPSYVAAFAWISTFPALDGLPGAWVVLTTISLPYVVLPVIAALRALDPAHEEVARSLGRGPVRTFLGVVVPQVMPAAAAGALLAALYTLADFGAVAVMRADVFTRTIYASYRASFDRTSAAVLALVLVALAALLVVLEQKARRRGAAWRVGSGAPRERTRVDLGRWTAPAVLGLGALVAVSLAVPAYGLLSRLLQTGGTTVDLRELGAAMTTTFAVAAAGAVVALLLAIPIGVLAARYRDRVTRTVEGGAYIAHALPAVVIGLSLVFLTLSLLPGLYQTAIVVAFAYAVMFLPNAIGAVRTSTAQVPPAQEQVARSLGRTGLTAWRDVTLRQTLPGLGAGLLLVLLTAMKELPATLMLRPSGFDTLATELWTRTEVAAYAAAAPYAVALVLVAAIPAFLISRSLDRTSQGIA